MSTLRNNVQLIGNIGQQPEIINLDNGKKVVRFSLATNETYKKDNEKVTQTDWHTIVAWNKVAEIIEKYTTKGSEIAISGKLKTRSYTNDKGETVYTTEVVANEVLLLGKK